MFEVKTKFYMGDVANATRARPPAAKPERQGHGVTHRST